MWTGPSKQAQDAQDSGPRSVAYQLNRSYKYPELLTSATQEIATRTKVKILPGANDKPTLQSRAQHKALLYVGH